MQSKQEQQWVWILDSFYPIHFWDGTQQRGKWKWQSGKNVDAQKIRFDKEREKGGWTKKDSKRSNSVTLLSKREDSENREQWKMNNFNSLASEQGHKGQTITDERSMQKATTRERDGGKQGNRENGGKTILRGARGG